MQRPKLSVIIPAYNAENTLRKCIDSVLGQDLSKDGSAVEIVVIDDGSVDSTASILEEYASQYPDSFRALSVTNGGQGRARNFGLEQAGGEYIGFVDSDDWIEASMYRVMVETAEKNDADLVICDVTAHFPDGTAQPEPVYRPDRAIASAGFANNKLFRRELLQNIRFPEERLWYEDTEFTAIAIQRARLIEHVEQALYHYRRGLPSTMNNSNAVKNLDILTVMQHLEDEFLPQNRDDFEFLVLNHVLLDAMNRVQAMRTPEKREVLRLMRYWVHEKIPKLGHCRSFREETGNRRLIMRLHYMGMSRIAEALLDMKKTVRAENGF